MLVSIEVKVLVLLSVEIEVLVLVSVLSGSLCRNRSLKYLNHTTFANKSELQ